MKEHNQAIQYIVSSALNLATAILANNRYPEVELEAAQDALYQAHMLMQGHRKTDGTGVGCKGVCSEQSMEMLLKYLTGESDGLSGMICQTVDSKIYPGEITAHVRVDEEGRSGGTVGKSKRDEWLIIERLTQQLEEIMDGSVVSISVPFEELIKWDSRPYSTEANIKDWCFNNRILGSGNLTLREASTLSMPNKLAHCGRSVPEHIWRWWAFGEFRCVR